MLKHKYIYAKIVHSRGLSLRGEGWCEPILVGELTYIE